MGFSMYQLLPSDLLIPQMEVTYIIHPWQRSLLKTPFKRSVGRTWYLTPTMRFDHQAVWHHPAAPFGSSRAWRQVNHGGNNKSHVTKGRFFAFDFKRTSNLPIFLWVGKSWYSCIFFGGLSMSCSVQKKHRRLRSKVFLSEIIMRNFQGSLWAFPTCLKHVSQV